MQSERMKHFCAHVAKVPSESRPLLSGVNFKSCKQKLPELGIHAQCLFN